MLTGLQQKFNNTFLEKKTKKILKFGLFKWFNWKCKFIQKSQPWPSHKENLLTCYYVYSFIQSIIQCAKTNERTTKHKKKWEQELFWKINKLFFLLMYSRWVLVHVHLMKLSSCKRFRKIMNLTRVRWNWIIAIPCGNGWLL